MEIYRKNSEVQLKPVEVGMSADAESDEGDQSKEVSNFFLPDDKCEKCFNRFG